MSCQITGAAECAELVMERAVPHNSVEVAGHDIGQVWVAYEVRVERGCTGRRDVCCLGGEVGVIEEKLLNQLCILMLCGIKW